MGLQGSTHKLSDGDSVPAGCPWLSGKGINPPSTPGTQETYTTDSRLQPVCVADDTSVNQDSHRKCWPTTGPQSLQRLGCPGRCQANPPRTPEKKHTLANTHALRDTQHFKISHSAQTSTTHNPTGSEPIVTQPGTRCEAEM